MPSSVPHARRRAIGSAVLSAALCALLVGSIDVRQLAAALADGDAWLVAGAGALVACIPVLAAERWLHACRAAGIAAPRPFAFSANYAGLFAGQFLPSGIGTDAVRLALLWRQRYPVGAGVASLAVDRACGVGALLALLALGLPFVIDRLPAGAAGGIGIAAAVGLAVGFAVLCADLLPLPAAARRGRPGRLLGLLRTTRVALATREALGALALGTAIHVLSLAAVWLLAHAFGHRLPFAPLISVTAAAIFLAMLPLSFNGWGVREGALMFGLAQLGVPRESGLLIAFVYGAAGTLAALPGAVAWRRLRRAAGDARARTPAPGADLPGDA